MTWNSQMNSKIIFTILFMCITVFRSYAQKTSEYNKNFKSRFEYVTSFFDYVTEYEEDFLLSLNVIEKGSKQLDFVVIGIKELFQVLNKEPFTSKDQLYFSVGKIFLRDTLYVEGESHKVLKRYIVDKDSLAYFNKLPFNEVVSKYTIEGQPGKVGLKGERALIFYFDRRFYPTVEPHNSGYVVKLNYDFSQGNNNSIYRRGKRYLQWWDKYGNFISESPED